MKKENQTPLGDGHAARPDHFDLDSLSVVNLQSIPKINGDPF